MKKIGLLLFCIIFTVVMFPLTAYGDMGPKPSITIDFQGLKDHTYFVTLLSKDRSRGPHSVLDEEYGYSARYEEGDENYHIFLKFVEYEDKDGYYFLQYFKESSETQEFSWTYYPPKDFKVLLYFPEADNFIVSKESYTRYAFNSYFTAKISDDEISIESSYDYRREGFSLVGRIFLTILVELGIALLFGFRGKSQIGFIVLVNIITQIGLNLTLNLGAYYGGPWAAAIFYFLGELIVLVVEIGLYMWYFKKRIEIKMPYWKILLYTFVANIVSFVVGFLLAFWIPGMF